MLQNARVSTRHASIHACQFRAQYAHEKQFVKTKLPIPLCRWRGALMAGYRSDPTARAS